MDGFEIISDIADKSGREILFFSFGETVVASEALFDNGVSSIFYNANISIRDVLEYFMGEQNLHVKLDDAINYVESLD